MVLPILFLPFLCRSRALVVSVVGESRHDLLMLRLGVRQIGIKDWLAKKLHAALRPRSFHIAKLFNGVCYPLVSIPLRFLRLAWIEYVLQLVQEGECCPMLRHFE